MTQKLFCTILLFQCSLWAIPIIRGALKYKRSNLFGKLYKNNKVVFKGDIRQYQGDKSKLKYVGSSLKNWMRLTYDGIGIHASKYVWRKPNSNGCIRVPFNVAEKLFAVANWGTKVSIRN